MDSYPPGYKESTKEESDYWADRISEKEAFIREAVVKELTEFRKELETEMPFTMTLGEGVRIFENIFTRLDLRISKLTEEYPFSPINEKNRVLYREDGSIVEPPIDQSALSAIANKKCIKNE